MSLKYSISLIREFTLTDFKLRYKGSILGYFWSLLNPLLMLITLYFVFSRIADFNIEYYELYLLLGIVIWNFFSEASINSVNSMIGKSGLFKKFNFPLESVVISSCLVYFISLILNLLIIFLFMIILKVSFSFKILLLPFYLLQLFILVLGFSFLLSALYIKFEDVMHLWTFLLLIGFFITPIIYPLDIIPFEYLRYYLLNPIARIIVDTRFILIYDYIPDLKNFFITLFISIIIFLIGWFYFRSQKKRFVERL